MRSEATSTTLETSIEASIGVHKSLPELDYVVVDLSRDYVNRATGFNTFPFHGVVPPMKKLVLIEYQWQHLESYLEQVWGSLKPAKSLRQRLPEKVREECPVRSVESTRDFEIGRRGTLRR